MLASTISNARSKSGLTQNAVADKVGVPRSTMFNWEAGRCMPTVQSFSKLVAVLGIRPKGDGLASAIQEARSELGLTQEQLAGEIGVPRSTVFNWEAGRCAPRPESFSKLIGVLGIRPGDIA